MLGRLGIGAASICHVTAGRLLQESEPRHIACLHTAVGDARRIACLSAVPRLLPHTHAGPLRCIWCLNHMRLKNPAQILVPTRPRHYQRGTLVDSRPCWQLVPLPGPALPYTRRALHKPRRAWIWFWSSLPILSMSFSEICATCWSFSHVCLCPRFFQPHNDSATQRQSQQHAIRRSACLARRTSRWCQQFFASIWALSDSRCAQCLACDLCYA